jgi:hypothetical protein
VIGDAVPASYKAHYACEAAPNVSLAIMTPRRRTLRLAILLVAIPLFVSASEPIRNPAAEAYNADGTASSHLLNAIEGKWGQQRGYVPAEGAGIISEFCRGVGRGTVSLVRGLTVAFGLHSSKSSLERFQSEHYHWRVSTRKTLFENLANRAGALCGMLAPVWLLLFPKASVILARWISSLRANVPHVLRRFRSRATPQQRLILAIACPIPLILAGIGLMSALDIDHTDISENWWCWMLLVILVGLFEYFWFAPTTTTAGNSESDLDSRP